MGADTRDGARSALDIQRGAREDPAEHAVIPARRARVRASSRPAASRNVRDRSPSDARGDIAPALDIQGVPRPARTFARADARSELAAILTPCERATVGPHAHTPHASHAPSGAGSLRAAPLTDAERISLARAIARAGSLRAFEAVSGVPATTVHRAANGAAVTRLVRSALLRALPATARDPSADSPPERAAGGG